MSPNRRMREYLASLEQKQKSMSEVIKEATSDTDTYFFSEILMLDNGIEELERSGPEGGQTTSLLKLFCYGCMRDYKRMKEIGEIKELNQQQNYKLIILTILSCASINRAVAFDTLKLETGITDDDELETYILAAMEAKLLNVKIDALNQRLLVYKALSRDVRPEELPTLRESLEKLTAASTKALSMIEGK